MVGAFPGLMWGIWLESGGGTRVYLSNYGMENNKLNWLLFENCGFFRSVKLLHWENKTLQQNGSRQRNRFQLFIEKNPYDTQYVFFYLLNFDGNL